MGICFSSSSSRRKPPCGGASTATPAWPDLPPDLAGVILGCLPSHADRVRFAAVCRHWRSAARQQLPLIPPPLPWISFNNGHFQILPGGEAHALPDPGPARLRCYSTFDGVVLRELHGRARACSLFDPFRDVSMDLPPPPPPPCRHGSGYDDPYAQFPKWPTFRKLLVCSDGGGGAAVAALFKPNFREKPKIIGICRPDAAGAAAWALHVRRDDDGWYEDVSFFRGKLYALDSRGHLYEFDLGGTNGTNGGGGGGRPAAKLTHPTRVMRYAPGQEEPVPAALAAAAVQGARRTTRRYLVVSGDKLLMIRWSIVEDDRADACQMSALGLSDEEPAMAFAVFQAGWNTTAWSEVTSTAALEDQVLFVSRGCSLALRASDYRYAGAGAGDAGVRGGRVFYLEDDGFARYVGRGRKWNLRVCGVYDLRDGTAWQVELRDGGRTWTGWPGDGDKDGGRTGLPLDHNHCHLFAVRMRATWFLPHAAAARW